ncbi:MAG: sensor histidine kinase [Verrucomicrobiota bacterium]
MDNVFANAFGHDGRMLAAQEKQLLLSRLLARLAHEIRNPLSSLDIHVQLLEEDLAQVSPALKERTAGRLAFIHGELQRLENIVRQFLNLAGPSDLELQPVEMPRIIGHVCELLRPEAAARGIEIAMHVPASLPMVAADPVQLTQALVNLVINAIQATAGRGRIDVTVRTDATWASIEVRDTGSGLPAGRHDAIFEPFFTTKPEGSGLGLWIVQQIVTAHGGVVTTASPPEGGAIFTVQLPLPKAEPAHEQSAH